MALELGNIVGKIGGGGEVEIRNVDIGAAGAAWDDVGELVVTQHSMVSVVAIFTPTAPTRWGDPTPSIRVLKAGETETVDNSLRGHLSNNSNARNDALSVAGVLPPGTYTIAVHTHGSNRSFTVSTILISQTPTTHPSTL